MESAAVGAAPPQLLQPAAAEVAQVAGPAHVQSFASVGVIPHRKQMNARVAFGIGPSRERGYTDFMTLPAGSGAGPHREASRSSAASRGA